MCENNMMASILALLAFHFLCLSSIALLCLGVNKDNVKCGSEELKHTSKTTWLVSTDNALIGIWRDLCWPRYA